MPQLDPARKSQMLQRSAELIDLINDTDPTPATNPLQATVDELTAALALRTQERDDAIAARNTLLEQIGGVRQLLTDLPPQCTLLLNALPPA